MSRLPCIKRKCWLVVCSRRRGALIDARNQAAAAWSMQKQRRQTLHTTAGSSNHDGPLHAMYYDLVQQRNVQADPHQLIALKELERLRTNLDQVTPLSQQQAPSTQSNSSSFSFLSNWLSSAKETVHDTLLSTMQPSVKGVYLHGGVGCGKTFLMNLFYDSITDGPWAASKQKVHFHAFMLNVHRHMHLARHKSESSSSSSSDAIIPTVVNQILSQGHLICFDEFQVTDVADAMILQRLFNGIWKAGGVVVTTSNRPPQDLYLNGLQRDLFLPFIALLQRKCQVVDMWKSDTDYRLMQLKVDGNNSVFFVGADGKKQFDALFYKLVGATAVAPTFLQTQGRHVHIPQAALTKSIARFSFEDLCQKALGAADYLIIGEHFHTVFVDMIPQMSMNELNWVRRFITFVDSMYECHVKLILQAKTEQATLFQRARSDTDHDEVFAFDRTLSRLEEMSSQKYLATQQRGNEKHFTEKQERLRTFTEITVRPVEDADYDSERFKVIK
ncbi:hypothetical protein MPSEU_000460300 [Mayamaea pseudoterrestris]|nr:hypothetical protein MPSEU_000460300 [Mayamaea pseudoterrestris]